MNAVEISDLSKSFGLFKMSGLNLEVSLGTIMGIVGENGSGKSTLFKLIMGSVAAESGSIRLFGEIPNKKRHLLNEDIGYVSEDFPFPKNLNVKKVRKVMKKLFTNWDDEVFCELSQKLSLPTDKKFKHFSSGMKRKLMVVLALSHKPKLLILDEPTNALDAVSRKILTDIIFDFTRNEENTVLISSHIMTDLEKLCDYLVFMRNGKIVLKDEKDKLLSDFCVFRCSPTQRENAKKLGLSILNDSEYAIEGVAMHKNVPGDWNVSTVSLEELFEAISRGGFM